MFSVGLRVLKKASVCLLATMLLPVLAQAHSPHDTIDAIGISPEYHADGTVFIAVTRHLLRSNDHGETWRNLVNGLDNEFYFSSIVLSPNFGRDATLLVATRGSGVYRSESRGEKWISANKGLKDKNVVSLKAIKDQSGAIHFLALSANGNTFQTTDGGSNWNAVENTGVFEVIAAGKTTFLAASNTGGIFNLSDEKWQKVGQLPPSTSASALLEMEGTLFVGTRNGVIFTKDTGADNQFREVIDLGDPITSMTTQTDELGRKIVLVTAWNTALFYSKDNGHNWSKIGEGLTTDEQASAEPLYISPQFRDVVAATSSSGNYDTYIAGFDGLFKLNSGLTSWVELETRPVANVKGLAVGAATDKEVLLVLSTYGGGIYRSENGGKDWSVGNYGVQTTRFSDIAISPDYRTDKTVFTGVQRYLVKSTDGGQSWRTISHKDKFPVGLFAKRVIRKLLRVLGFDDTADGFIAKHEFSHPYPHSLAISPSYSEDNVVFIGTRWHGLLKSEDGGNSSDTVLTVDSENNTITNIRLSPTFGNDGVAYTSVRNEGLYKSEDYGNNWKLLNTTEGLTKGWKAQNSLANSIAHDVHIELSKNYEKDSTLLAGTNNGLFRSENAGATWMKIDVNPKLDNEIVMSLGSASNGRWLVSIRGYGLYTSVDNGITFTQVFSDLLKDNQEFEYIAFSPFYRKDNKVFLGSDASLILGYLDGRWEKVSRSVRYEENRAQPVRFTGDWQIKEGKSYSGWSERYSTTKDANVELEFTGSGVAIFGTHQPKGAEVRIVMDDHIVSKASQYSKVAEPGKETFAIRGLEYGRHKVKLEVLNGEDVKGKVVSIDYFDVYGIK